MMEQHLIDGILTVLGVIGTGFLGYLAKAIVKFIVSKHLEVLARQAVHYAEDAFKYYSGPGKLKAACEWVSKIMKQYHIKISEAQIEGAVRAAYKVFVEAAEKELKKETSTNVHVNVDANKPSNTVIAKQVSETITNSPTVKAQ